MDTTFSPTSITSTVNNYGNAGLRLWSILSGSGRAYPSYDNTNGVQVDENIQCSLTVNSVQCTLFDMRIYNAAHRIFNTVDISGQIMGGYTSPYTKAVLEAYIFFKDNRNNVYALVLPIGINNNKPNTYASQYIGGLTNLSDGNSKQPTLSTLFQDLSGSTPNGSFNAKNPILQYIGQDVRKMNCSDKSATPNPVTYLVIMNDMKSTKLLSTTITKTQLNSFLAKFTNAQLSVQSAPIEISQSVITGNNIVYIPGKTFFITNSSSGSGASNVNTSALKCYPVDPSKNVKDGQLYLDENGVPIPFPDYQPQCGKIPSLPSPAASSFWSSAVGIESLIAITIAGILVVIAIYFLGVYWFSKKDGATSSITSAATAAAATAAATSIATKASITSGITSQTISWGVMIWLAVIATIFFGVAVTYILLYYGIIPK